MSVKRKKTLIIISYSHGFIHCSETDSFRRETVARIAAVFLLSLLLSSVNQQEIESMLTN